VTADHSEHLTKARRLLRQAQALSTNDAPESVVHLSYYAMFHAATAVLLRHHNRSAVTHMGLIGAFGRFARDRGETARQHGRALNRAEDLRLQADYGVSYHDLSEAAENLRNEASAFINFCESVVME
jgi:uncharacterized protein (UPF0332 family)